MDRTGCIHAPRPLLHGQALHAQTNCTSPSFSLPSNGAPPRLLTVILSPPSMPLHLSSFYLRSFRKDCGSSSLVWRHHRDALSAPPHPADHDHPRLRNGNKPHEHNRRSHKHRRRIAVHTRHHDAPSVARMHRRTRCTSRTHLYHLRTMLA